MSPVRGGIIELNQTQGLTPLDEAIQKKRASIY
jgi:hypothetical protein